jgi:hypothetical protein
VRQHEIRKEKIYDILGEGVNLEWLDLITEIRNRNGPNCVILNEQNRVDGQKALRNLLVFDARELPIIASRQEKTPELMSMLAEALMDLLPYIPPGSSQLDVYRMAEGSRLVGSVLATSSGVANADTYRALIAGIEGREIPEYIPDEAFDAAIRLGISPATIVSMKDIQSLNNKMLEESEKLDKTAVAGIQGLESRLRDAGWTWVDEDAPVVTVPVLNTTDQTVEIEPTPPEVSTADFGGAPSRQEESDTGPRQTEPDVSDVVNASESPLEVDFTARRIED